MIKSEKYSRYEHLRSRAQHTHSKAIEGAAGSTTNPSWYAIYNRSISIVTNGSFRQNVCRQSAALGQTLFAKSKLLSCEKMDLATASNGTEREVGNFSVCRQSSFSSTITRRHRP